MQPETKTRRGGGRQRRAVPTPQAGTQPAIAPGQSDSPSESSPPVHPRAGETSGRPIDGRFVGERYRLEDRLGLGGSAEVWRAVVVDESEAERRAEQPADRQLGRPERGRNEVAVKLLHPYLVPDGRSKARLIGEARAVRQLHHRGIVQLRDVVLDDADVALVFDYVSGGSLADEIRRAGRIDARRAAEVAAGVAEALAYAHERGIVHRDVTPGNVLLDDEGRPCLADFGIARLLEESAATVTVTGTVLGTLRYMAPEQLAGGEVDGKADVYSLGAVLYEMLAGRPPYDARTPVALVEQHASPPPPPPSDVPASLATIALASLRSLPADRPSAAALHGALRAWLEDEPFTLPQVTAAFPRGHVPIAIPGAGRAAPRRDPRGPVVAALVAIGVLIVGAGLGGLFDLHGAPSEAVAPATAPPPTSTSSQTPTPIPTLPPGPSLAPIAPAPVAPAVKPAAHPHATHHKHGGGHGRGG